CESADAAGLRSSRIGNERAVRQLASESAAAPNRIIAEEKAVVEPALFREFGVAGTSAILGRVSGEDAADEHAVSRASAIGRRVATQRGVVEGACIKPSPGAIRRVANDDAIGNN